MELSLVIVLLLGALLLWVILSDENKKRRFPRNLNFALGQKQKQFVSKILSNLHFYINHHPQQILFLSCIPHT